MSKRTLNVTVDNEILEEIEKIDGGNTSEKVNNLLKKALLTEKTIEEKVQNIQKQAKNDIKRLKYSQKEVENDRKELINDLPKGLKEDIKGGITYLGDVTIRNPGIKKILNETPERIEIWINIVNKRYNKSYTKEELLEIINRF